MTYESLKPLKPGRRSRHTPLQSSGVVLYLLLASVIVYAVIIPLTCWSLTPKQQVSLTFHAVATPRKLAVAPEVAVQQQQERTTPKQRSSNAKERHQWPSFWSSDLPGKLSTLQQLKHTIDHMRYQRLTKDVEHQDTAGLDVSFAATLQQMSAESELQHSQIWLKSEVTNTALGVINQLQFPSNCSAVKKLYCQMKACGFGCQMHHAAHCLAIAIATNRTMILLVYPSMYVKGPTMWEHYFAPLSSCTTTVAEAVKGRGGRAELTVATGLHMDQDEVSVNIIDYGALAVDAPAVPPDVLEIVQLFHARPHVWWQGLLVSWLLRPSLGSQLRQSAFRSQHGWSSPIAGVHVRRTDKTLAEAKLHEVAEYMTHVERFCDLKCKSGWQQRALTNWKTAQSQNDTEASPSRTQLPTSECTVYLASDEEQVVSQVKDQYKHMNIITNPIGFHTGSLETRYTNEGLEGIYDDMIHLAHTDFIVGTFSSQVSRLAYEIAQVNTTAGVIDASFNYHSVDSQWYLGGQAENRFCVTQDYTAVGQQLLTAGQQVMCPTIYEYKKGYMVCHLPGNMEKVMVPPGSLTPCKEAYVGAYRPILPEPMRRAHAPANQHDQQVQ